MKDMKKLIIITLVLSMVFAPIIASAETKGFYREDYQLTPNSKVVGVIQQYGTAWYGGATQGFQALIQMVPTEKLTHEKIKLEWYRQYGKCPNDDQIQQVQKGWDQTLVWLKQKGAQEEIVKIFSSFGYPLDAPGPKILAAIVRMVSDVGSAAIGGFFLKEAFRSLRPDETNISGVSQAEGGKSSNKIDVENQPKIDVENQPKIDVDTGKGRGGDRDGKDRDGQNCGKDKGKDGKSQGGKGKGRN